jgi:hypothetical protein
MFGALAAELADPAAAGLTACQLEDLLDERGREVLRQLLQDHFDLRAAREERQAREQRAPPTGAVGITRTRLETGHGRLLATLFGTVLVTRCAWRRPGARNSCPADAALSLPGGRHSHSLARLAAIEAARGSFDAAHAAVARRCGPVIGKRQLEESVVNAAAGIPAFYAARITEPCTSRTLVVISADSKGIVMRPGALRAATARAAARLGKKWLGGSVRKDPAEMIAAAFEEAEARDPLHLRTWVVLVDGAEHQLELIRAEAARRAVTIHVVIDLIHVLEYIWKPRGACTRPATPPPRTGSRSRHSRYWPATATGSRRRSPPRPAPPACPAASETARTPACAT